MDEKLFPPLSTAGIAAVATTSALLAKPVADLLLKVVKPLVKKTIKKIAAKLGKHEQHYSAVSYTHLTLPTILRV